MSIISEAYFTEDERDWDYDGQYGESLFCIAGLRSF